MRDLLVAGGGPVGLATALYAARAGLDVTVREPRAGVIDKACGEGLMPGALAALRDLGVPVRVTGLLALAENMVSGSAYRPGDVVTHYGGTTTEIGNTDAEGRIVLADALAYADAELDPSSMV